MALDSYNNIDDKDIFGSKFDSNKNSNLIGNSNHHGKVPRVLDSQGIKNSA